jgi:hypothetical protein
MNIGERWVSEKEVEKIVGRAIQTLRNDRSKGQGIPYAKIGRLVRYRLADVEDYLSARRVETSPL